MTSKLSDRAQISFKIKAFKLFLVGGLSLGLGLVIHVFIVQTGATLLQAAQPVTGFVASISLTELQSRQRGVSSLGLVYLLVDQIRLRTRVY